MIANRLIRFVATAVLLVIGLVGALSAQGRGGAPPGGGGGMGGGMPSFTRLGVLTMTLKLDEAQKKDAKEVLDQEFAAAEPLRKALLAARQKLGAAVQAADQAAIDQATSAYTAQATAMAAAEAAAVAKLVAHLKSDQAAPAAVQTVVSLMRGALAGKKWDTTPDLRFY